MAAAKTMTEVATTRAEVQVALPAHCSSLGLLPSRIGEFLPSPAGRTGRRGRGSGDGRGEGECAVLAVQCHRDGLAWRDFVPMLRRMSDPALERVVRVLVTSFGRSVRVFAPASDGGRAEARRQEEGVAEGSSAPPPPRRWHDRRMRRRRRTLKSGGVGFRRLLLVILPGRSPSPSLRPEWLWSSRLAVLENRLLVLRSLSAFIATLGGGFFLCRYLATAVRLARWQRRVALELGDLDLAARCTVNEAYNYIHYGRVGGALRMVAAVREEALRRGDGLTVRMCGSARAFALGVRRANLEEGAERATRDEMQRVRIVRNGAKVNRIFAPLGELQAAT